MPLEPGQSRDSPGFSFPGPVRMAKLQSLKPRIATLSSTLRTTARLGINNPDSWRAGGLTTSERGYGWKWQKAREAFLKHPENVLCRACTELGLVVVATVVDHIVPHRGDQGLFWDRDNWQPLCKTCHDRKTATEGAALRVIAGR